MPPTSRQFLASPSAPSDVLTVRTIASRSPGRTTNKGEGRAGTLPGSGWMPSPPPRHHLATDRPATRRAAPRAACHPSHLASLLFRMLSSPSAPSPAAHRVASPTKEREERATCPAMGGCHHHHLATTSRTVTSCPKPLSSLPRLVQEISAPEAASCTWLKKLAMGEPWDAISMGVFGTSG